MAAAPASMTAGQNLMVGGGVDEIATIMTLQITALSGATVKVQGSMDGGTTKVDLQMMPWGSSTGVSSATATGGFRCDVAGIPNVYLDCAAGTATISYRFVNG